MNKTFSHPTIKVSVASLAAIVAPDMGASMIVMFLGAFLFKSIINFGDSSIDYMLRFWITDPAAGLTNIKGDVYLALWQTFAEHKVTIPFPRNEVRILEPNRPQDFPE